MRWNIEMGYRYFKELLTFDQYQLLTLHGIGRFRAIQFLTQNFLGVSAARVDEADAKPHAMTCGTPHSRRAFRANDCLRVSTSLGQEASFRHSKVVWVVCLKRLLVQNTIALSFQDIQVNFARLK